MFRNYLKTAFRNILRQKGYSFINIIGLSTGLAAFILIMLWVINELSYNRNNHNYHRIYRFVQEQQYSTGPLTTPCMPAPLAADVKSDFPEFEDVFRYYTISGVLSVGENKFADDITVADSGLFNVFSFDFIAGNPQDAMQPYTVILSERGAQKYFGNADPMGRVIRLNDDINFRVNGIIENPPENSSFTGDIYMAFDHLEDLGWNLDRYGWNTYYMYTLVGEKTDMDALNEKLKHYFRIARNDETNDTELFLFPLGKQRLYRYDGEPYLITNIYIFSAIAVFILLIACINFMNLATARASKRGREIGLRKVAGARRKQLIQQFMSESLLISLFALLVALLVVYLTLPLFNELTSRELSLNLVNPFITGSLLLATLLTGIVAGSYPALYLSGVKPLKSIRSSGGMSGGNAWFRRSLVVFQFVLSITLIISTLVIYRQTDYIQSKNLGMNREHVIFARLRGDLSENFYDFKSRLLQSPDIKNVTRASHVPYYVGSNSGGLIWEGKENEDDVLIGVTRADYDFLKTMEMQLVDGRFFEEGYGRDSAAVVVNEAAVKTMGMDNPVGKWIGFENDAYRTHIIGVVKDFNFLPLDREIEPLAIYYNPGRMNLLIVRLNGEKTSQAIEQIETTWNDFLPAFPFEFYFMSDHYDMIYTHVTRLGKLIKYFAILAIIISCLGLLGLASYTAEQKTKEIGIRKVLGSSVTGIVKLQQKEFFWLVLIANLVAWPLAWYFMNEWLNEYAYKIALSPFFFIIAGGLSIAITFLTVFTLSYRAAVKNPVDAIKHE